MYSLTVEFISIAINNLLLFILRFGIAKTPSWRWWVSCCHWWIHGSSVYSLASCDCAGNLNVIHVYLVTRSWNALSAPFNFKEIIALFFVQFEDFQSKWAFKLLQRYRNTYRMFNDDVQVTLSFHVVASNHLYYRFVLSLYINQQGQCKLLAQFLSKASVYNVKLKSCF